MLPPELSANAEKVYDYNDLKSLKAALNDPNIDINLRYGEYTALEAAIEHRWVEGVERLLERPEIQVNLKNEDGDTPLHRAVGMRNHQILARLLQFPGVNVNAKNNKDETPLSCALNPGSYMYIPEVEVDFINLLLSAKGVELNPVEIHHVLCALMKSTRTGYRSTEIGVLNFLFSHPRTHDIFENFSEDDELKTLWCAAMEERAEDKANKFWFSSSSDRERQQKMEIKATVVFKTLMRFIKQKPDFKFEDAIKIFPDFLNFPRAQDYFNYSKKTMTTYAGNVENAERVIFCFGFSIVHDLFSQDNSRILPSYLLHRAASHFYVDEQLPFFKRLLQDHQDQLNRKNPEGDTPLHIAVRRGQIPLVRFLLAQDNCDPTLANEKGDTPLHIAMKENNAEMVQLLLNHSKMTKSSIKAQNNEGNTPLHVGVEKGSTAACKELLSDERLTEDMFNAKNKRGNTPYLLTIVHERREIERLLRKTPMNLNHRDSDGLTPLHWAVEEHNLEAVAFFIGKGVALNMKTTPQAMPSRKITPGETPLHIAAKYYASHPEVFFALFNASGIEVNKQDGHGNTACHRILRELFSDNRLSIDEEWLDDEGIEKGLGDARHFRIFHGDKIRKVEEMAHLVFNDPRVDITLENKANASLLQYAINADSIVIFKLLVDRLRAINKGSICIKGLETIPDPKTEPKAFASHPSMKLSPRITASLGFESILKNDPNLTCEAVFAALTAQAFPGHKTWREEIKQAAFDQARYALGLFPEHLFALTVFLCDGLLKLKQNTNDLDIDAVVAKKTQRFFTMAGQLPLDLQMVLCNVAACKTKKAILSKDSEPAFKDLAWKCQNRF